MTVKKPKSKSLKEPWRNLALDHAGEIFAGITGVAIIFCATMAAIFGALDSNALAVILGGAAGAGSGYAAGKTNK